jgi:hypothetical protein
MCPPVLIPGGWRLKTKTGKTNPTKTRPQSAFEPITASIPAFCRISGVGRSKAYELINSGAVKTVRIGHRQFVVLESFRDLIERQLSEE